MAKVKHRSLYELPDLIKGDKLPPVIFLCGEDSYAIDGAVRLLIEVIEPQLGSDFDKEIISAEKKSSAQQIVDLLFAFPFGGSKKLVVVKDFANVDDKKIFSEIISSPPDYLYLIITQPGKVNATKIEPYASLHKNKYMFEAEKLKQHELADWLVKHAKKNKTILSYENALALTEIVGEEKSLLEMQMQKFYDNLGEEKEITFDIITNLASSTRKYTTFNLQDAVGKGNKSKALEIAYNLLDNGTEIGQMISMLNTYCLFNAQSLEFSRKKIDLSEAAKLAEANYFYFMNSTKQNIFKDKKRLMKASDALLKADISVKTSTADHKTILTMLISEMISK
ncbi:dna polymerase iii delta subunit [hydrocarbon metagenome]|uniref:DNA polymerase III subunit delta n=1 Tax=hydrocarbon metagenome TaxID=938273 RepID=A0A0W8G0K0_9ZZZZ